MATHYRQEVSELVKSLNDLEHRTEAAMLIRGLIDRIVLKPNEARDALLTDLHGDLAGILQVATNKSQPLGVESLDCRHCAKESICLQTGPERCLSRRFVFQSGASGMCCPMT